MGAQVGAFVTPSTEDFKMSRKEFVALVAMMFAIVAFSMDAMLPALPSVAAELSPTNPERAPLILTAFFFGLGVGTFLAGPLSDAYGRKRIMFLGSMLYVASAAVAWATHSLELMLVARAFQGLGAAGPRVVAMAVTRDLFSGREMARIVSLIMMVFALAPGVAPALAVGIINVMGWRAIFLAFIAFALISMIWMMLRLPETLPVENRRPMRFGLMKQAVGEIFAHPVVRLSILVQSLAMATLISLLMVVHHAYADIYGRADSFPYWFGATALVSASASWFNATLVGRLGMRRLVTASFGAQIVLSGVICLFALTDLPEPYGFWAFLFWQFSLFLHAGLTLGNLNAMGLEPMGHIAGMTASIMGGVSTIMAAGLASPVIILIGASIAPMVFYIFALSVVGFLVLLLLARVEQRLRKEAMPVFVRHKKGNKDEN
jgi:DHA1 family bicyclomycin/chloramphenicol resistance-like MFS transporter